MAPLLFFQPLLLRIIFHHRGLKPLKTFLLSAFLLFLRAEFLPLLREFPAISCLVHLQFIFVLHDRQYRGYILLPHYWRNCYA